MSYTSMAKVRLFYLPQCPTMGTPRSLTETEARTGHGRSKYNGRSPHGRRHGDGRNGQPGTAVAPARRHECPERRTDRRFEEVKQEIKEVRQEVKQEVAASEQRILAQVNQRIDDLRDYIDANLLLKNNWRTFAVAALATAAVIGTFVLQLMEAIN